MDEKRSDDIVELDTAETKQVVGGTGPGSSPSVVTGHHSGPVYSHDDHMAKKK